MNRSSHLDHTKVCFVINIIVGTTHNFLLWMDILYDEDWSFQLYGIECNKTNVPGGQVQTGRRGTALENKQRTVILSFCWNGINPCYLTPPWKNLSDLSIGFSSMISCSLWISMFLFSTGIASYPSLAYHKPNNRISFLTDRDCSWYITNLGYSQWKWDITRYP